MTEYFIRYNLQTPASLKDQKHNPENWAPIIESKLPNNSELVFYNDYKDCNGIKIHSGINIDFLVSADDIKEAESFSGRWANIFKAVISFCANTEVSSVDHEQIFEHEEGQDERFFYHPIMPTKSPFTISRIRIIPPDLFDELMKKIVGLYPEEGDASDFRKVMRALYYHDKSLHQEKPEDEFTMLFIALNSLEYLLRRIYGEIEQTYECDDCDEVTMTKPDPKSGRIGLFEESEHLETDFKKINRARGNLFHAGKYEEAVEYNDELRTALRIAVLKVLDIDTEKFETEIFLDPLKCVKGQALGFEGKLENYSVKSLKDPNKPQLSINHDGWTFKREDGRVNMYLDNLEVNEFTPGDEQIELEPGYSLRVEGGDFSEEDIEGINYGKKEGKN